MRWDDWDESDSEGQVEDRRDEPGGADSEGITPQAAGDASATADRSGPPRSFSDRMWNPGMGQAPEGSLEAQAGFNDLPDQQGYINQLLQYGREKFNLTGGDNDADDQGGAPDNDADDQQSFRAGGPVEDDEDEALTTGGTQEQQQGGTSLGDVAGAAGQGVMNAMPGGFLASANNRQAVGDAAGQAWEGVKGAASSVANWAGDAPKRFMAYLSRADAAPHAAIKGLEQEVDPSGQMDPNDRTVAAVQQPLVRPTARRARGRRCRPTSSATTCSRRTPRASSRRAISPRRRSRSTTRWRACRMATASCSNLRRASRHWRRLSRARTASRTSSTCRPTI
jgi:hypothetical protein